MDLSKILAKMAEKAEMAEEQENQKDSDELEKFVLKFETEEEALNHARNLACLQPGGRILVLDSARDKYINAIVLQKNKDNVVFLVYDRESGELLSGKTSYSLIRFP